MKNNLSKLILIIVFVNSCRVHPDGSQLNLVMPGDPKSLDPAHSTDVRSGQICALLYDTLVRFGHSTEILPGLAEYWEISSDGLTYTFYLQKCVSYKITAYSLF